MNNYIGTVKDNYMFTNIVNTPRWFDLDDLPNEIWVDIKGFEGIYKISSYSRVKSLDRQELFGDRVRPRKGRMLKQYEYKDHYMGCGLSKNGKVKFFRVHRLVLIAFVPNPLNKPFGNHKDFNRKNNYLSNLEWATAKENTAHSMKAGRMRKMPQNFGKDNHMAKKVRAINIDTKNIKEFGSLRDAGEFLNKENKIERVMHSISRVCCGRRSMYAGYRWEYV